MSDEYTISVFRIFMAVIFTACAFWFIAVFGGC